MNSRYRPLKTSYSDNPVLVIDTDATQSDCWMPPINACVQPLIYWKLFTACVSNRRT